MSISATPSPHDGKGPFQPLSSTTNETIAVEEEKQNVSDASKCIVTFFDHNPAQRHFVQVAILFFWIVVALLFGGGLSITLRNRFGLNSGMLAEVGGIVDRGVSCEDGVAPIWKAFILGLTLSYSLLELFIARQTALGETMMRSNKRAVAISLGLGALARYDVLSDILFGLVAETCRSVVGIWSFVIFGLGVILAQGLPALCIAFGGRLSTHVGLKMLDFCLWLELIDVTREELELPADVEAKMTGVRHETEQFEKRLLGTGDASQDVKAVAKTLSPSQVAEVKAMIKELSQEERDKVFERDPDTVKNLALIARAKATAGAVRFICEDLGQGILQVKFLVDLWESIDINTRVFTISSIFANLLTSLGGPVHAFYTENENRKYYAKLPKLKDGSKFQGIDYMLARRPGVDYYESWALCTMVFHDLVKAGDGSLQVQATLTRRVVLREVEGSAIPTESTPIFMRSYLDPNNYASVEEKLAGVFNTKNAMLEIRSVESKVVRGSTGSSGYAYHLKVFPDCLKGELTDLDPDSGMERNPFMLKLMK